MTDHNHSGTQRGRPAHPDVLTPAEWKVADGVRHGLGNPQIAARQGISRNAVKFHVSNILGKLGLASRHELQRWTGVAASSTMKERSTMTSTAPFGAIGQIARTVSNIEEARNWYRDVLGLEPLFDAGTMAFFACNGIRLMLSEGEAGAESILYFRCGNLHEKIERLEAKGTKIVSAPHIVHRHEDGSEEWMAFVEDNDGRPLGLMATAPKS